MKKNRILAFEQSKKIPAEEIENISAGAAGTTSSITAHGTYSSGGGWDPCVDVNLDL